MHVFCVQCVKHRSGEQPATCGTVGPLASIINNIVSYLKSLRTVSWQRWLRLFVGTSIFGLGVALQARANIGVGPWDVLAQGIAKQIGLQLGTSIQLTGIAVLLVWIWLRQTPGIGTLVNILWIGQVVNWLVQIIPLSQDPVIGVLMMLASIVILGFATAFYLSANLGAGPRDGMMLGLRRRTGWSVRMSRTVIEGVVLVAGWLLGGQVGVGTVIVALFIGPAIQFMLRQLGRLIPIQAAQPART